MNASVRPPRFRVAPAALLVAFAAAFALTGRHTPDSPRPHRDHVPSEGGSNDSRSDGSHAASRTSPPPRSVAESLASMRLVDGLQIECVASEPLVEAPVAMAFDENGRLLVLEMRSYMPDVMGTGEKLPTNRLVVLEDKDADGRFESSSVLVDDLVLPRGVAPSHGGVLLIEPPSLYFCKDADGDGRAEVKRKLADGFLGIENPEHAGNGLVYGLDNWYHLSQHHTEFAFDLDSLRERPTPVHGQWGLTMDDAGRFYYTPNSTPLLMDAYPKHLASRSGGAAGIAENIAQPAAATFPIHATTGVNRGYMDGVLRPDGTLAGLTAACAPVIYRASLLGEAFRDDCFICEPAGQIVKRILLTPGDAAHPLPSGRNAYEKSEFLASDDERFRPVNTCVGPDGALYVCDMYRGVIQHKTYLTDYLKAQIKDRDLETPLNMGRIYRITPKGWTPKPLPRLAELQNELLVDLLSHADGWYRDTAQRLLVERKAPVASLVRALLVSSPSSRARLHAMGTLSGLGALEQADVAHAMRDSNPAVAALAFEHWIDFVGAIAADEALSLAAFSADPTLRAIVASRALVVAHRTRVVSLPDVARAVALALPDPICVDALVAAFDDPLVGADESAVAAVVRHLGSQTAWPAGPGEKRLTQRLAASLLRRGDAARSLLVELAADADVAPAARVFLQDQVIGAIKLKDEQPRVLTLASEPEAWMRRSRDDARAQLLAQASVYFDWKGRPPINRPRALKELTSDERDRFRRGELLFATCAGCHQGQGQGSPGQAATLAGSAILNGPADRAIKAIVYGLQGEYKVGDSIFKGQMPPTVYPTDEEYASVLTYARRSFGNTGTPVTPAQVAAVRAANAGRVDPFTREELQGR